MTTNRTKNLFVVVFLLAAGTEFVLRGPLRFLRYGYEWSDISQVYVPSRAWVKGLNPYSSDEFVGLCREATGGSPAKTDIRTHSPYPLTTLVVMSPLAALPWPAAHMLWTGVLTLSVFPMILALASFGRLAERNNTLLFAALTLALAPLHTGIAVGNVTVPAIAACAVVVWAAGRQKDVLAGILLGIACCVKPQVGVWFALYYLLRKRWRMVLVGAGLGTTLVAVGVLRLEVAGVSWLADFLRNARGFAVENRTVDFTEMDPIRFTLIQLQVLFYTLSKSMAVARGIAFAACMAMLGAWFWFSFKSEPRRPELLALSAMAVLSLLPFYHRNYDATVLIFPLCWLLSGLAGAKALSHWAFLFLLPFAVPGAALLQQLAEKGKIPAAITSGWWWNALVMPHQIWALLCLSILLLRAMAIPQEHTQS